MKELIDIIKSGGSIDWEESGLLYNSSIGHQLTPEQKLDMVKLFNIGIDIIKDETDTEIMSVFLPCIRRIYTGLSIYRSEKLNTFNPSLERLPFVFSNPGEIYNMLLKGYRTLKSGMSVLTTTDTQAEATALLCDDYIRSVKELIRKDSNSLIKVISRETRINDLLN